MDVMIIMSAFSFAFAEFVRECAASILKGMHDIMLMEKRQHTEDARFVHVYQSFFKVGKTGWRRESQQFLEDKDSVGCWLYAFVG